MSRRRVAVVVIASTVALAAVPVTHVARAADDAPAFSADELGDPTEEGSILQLLEPEEREALARSQMTGMRPEPEQKPEPPKEGLGDKIGKVGLSVATVAVSIGAVVAPFFLF